MNLKWEFTWVSTKYYNIKPLSASFKLAYTNIQPVKQLNLMNNIIKLEVRIFQVSLVNDIVSEVVGSWNELSHRFEIKT